MPTFALIAGAAAVAGFGLYKYTSSRHEVDIQFLKLKFEYRELKEERNELLKDVEAEKKRLVFKPMFNIYALFTPQEGLDLMERIEQYSYSSDDNDDDIDDDEKIRKTILKK